MSRPAVSRHLRVLRQAGVVSDRVSGRQRIYELQPGPLLELRDWLDAFGTRWELNLDALETEVHRSARDRRLAKSDHNPEQESA